MNVVEVLKAAKAKIDTPEKWTKGYYARAKDGNIRDATDKDACSFCSMGAIYSITDHMPEHGVLLAERVGAYLIAAMGTTVVDFNDRRAKDHEEVMAAWDRAIALAEAEAA